jgi:hypothetical protein
MALDLKSSSPVRLPNPSAQPFVTSLKTVRFFAVVFFWVVLVAVVAHVTVFVLTEYLGLYDAAVTAAPETVAPAPSPAPAAPAAPSGGAAAFGLFESGAAAAESKGTSFFGVPAGKKASEPEEKPAEPKLPGKAAPEATAAEAPKAPAASPETGVPWSPSKNETGKAAGELETPPPVKTPMTPEQHARRAEHYRDHTVALLQTLRVLGILFSLLLWITLFIYLQIALLGRLSGIRQLTNAVFVLLLFLATAVPWETVFPEVHIGAFYKFDDLLAFHADRMLGVERGIWGHPIGYYLRFFGMPVLSLVLLVLSYANFSSGYGESVVANEQ